MNKLWEEWKKTIFLGFIILLVALGLRLYNLTYLPVFVDEAIYIRWAQIMRAESTLRFLPLSDGKQPLFMWSIIPFLKLIQDPLIAGRMLSVLSGMATLVGIFTLTYYLFKSKKAALLASAIYAISPYALFFDRIGLVDSMLSMFGVWTLFLGIVTMRTLRLDFAMLTGFALGGALLTKSPAIFFVILFPLTWFLSKWPKDKKKRLVHFGKLTLLLLVTYTLSLMLYNILRLGPNFHLVGSRNQDYVFPISHLLTSPTDPFLPYIDRVLEWFWALGPSVLVVFFAAAVLFGAKRYKGPLFVLSAWALIPIFVQAEYAKVFTTRYVLFSLPIVVIIAALTLLIVRQAKKKFWKQLFFTGLVLFTVHAFYIDYLLLRDLNNVPFPRVMRFGYLEEWTAGTGIREVSQIIREEYIREPDKKIVVGTEGFFGTLPDGLQIYLNDLPEITVIGIGLGIKAIPNQLVESKEAGNKTYLVVNSSRLKADPEDLELDLIAVYPKAFRPESTGKYIQHGPRESLYLFEVK